MEIIEKNTVSMLSKESRATSKNKTFLDVFGLKKFYGMLKSIFISGVGEYLTISTKDDSSIVDIDTTKIETSSEHPTLTNLVTSGYLKEVVLAERLAKITNEEIDSCF